MDQVLGARLAPLVLVLGACSRPPDFEAFCKAAAPCEGKPISSCVADQRELWEEQKQRGCGREGAEVIACQTAHGQCQTAGSWTLYMPTDDCLPATRAFESCLK